jgi:hypothetical protein
MIYGKFWFSTHGTLQDQIHKRQGDHSIHQEFAMLGPALIKLRTFADTWMTQVGPRIDTSSLWSFTRLVLKVFPSSITLHHVLTI